VAVSTIGLSHKKRNRKKWSNSSRLSLARGTQCAHARYLPSVIVTIIVAIFFIQFYNQTLGTSRAREFHNHVVMSRKQREKEMKHIRGEELPRGKNLKDSIFSLARNVLMLARVLALARNVFLGYQIP
jgi:hypothetical protein